MEQQKNFTAQLHAEALKHAGGGRVKDGGERKSVCLHI